MLASDQASIERRILATDAVMGIYVDDSDKVWCTVLIGSYTYFKEEPVACL